MYVGGLTLTYVYVPALGAAWGIAKYSELTSETKEPKFKKRKETKKGNLRVFSCACGMSLNLEEILEIG